MKKILLVTRPICPPWDEASKNFVYYLAKNISGFNFYLLTNGILPDLPPNIIQEPVYTANKFNFSQKARSFFYQFRSRNQFDIAHYFFTPTKLNSFLIKNFIRNQKAKTIQTIATLREDLFSDEEIKSLMFGSLIITYSDYAKNKLNSLGFSNVKRIYPGIDLEEYKARGKSPELMEKYNFTKQDFIINFSGEYTRLGAIDDVIESFIRISKQIPTAKLSLAVRVKNSRDAEKKKEVEDTLKKNDLFNKVTFHDDGNYKMADIYNLCDISIFPVRNMKGKFDVPLAVIEAMACEKPVIISDIPILKEFANNKNSVTIEKGNAGQLSRTILDFYQNSGKRETTGRNAREYVRENFDIKNVAEEYRKIYESL